MLIESIRTRAEEDLGFTIEFDEMDGIAALQRAVTKPESYDLYDNWHALDLVWTAGAVQPIELARIDQWDNISILTKTGSLTGHGYLGQGAVPAKSLYVQSDRSLGPDETAYIPMLPTVHNVDAFGFHPAIYDHISHDEPHSWAWLLDERLKGRVALISNPTVGAIEAALAAQSAGLAHFDDLGNLTVAEIDSLIDILRKMKRLGHFRSFWNTGSESVELLKRNRVLISTIWSPALTELWANGIAVRCSQPIEGYRGWHSGICISAAVSDRKREMCIEFLNWYLSGYAGAVMARQGYYMSPLPGIRKHLDEAEWDYWYRGMPSREDLAGPDGRIVVHEGEIRDGGSYEARMSKVAVWNLFMDEHNYLTRRWIEMLKS